MPQLNITDLRKSFHQEVLRGVNLTVTGGSVVALLGENGSGKTTLLTCLLGLHTYSGSVDVTDGEGRSLPIGGRVFGVLDRFLLYPRWTVAQNVAYFLNDRRGFEHPAVTSLVPRTWRKTRAGTLSTGQVKLVTMGIAFASSAPVLALDEFVNGLDQHARDLVKQRISRARDQEQRLIIATGHDLAVLEDVATHAHILRDGRLTDVSSEVQQGRNIREVYREHLERD